MTASESSTYKVSGMTCQHCAATVTGEISGVPGVSDVEVDLDGARVTVTGDGFSEDAVRAAVSEAGYELVP